MIALDDRVFTVRHPRSYNTPEQVIWEFFPAARLLRGIKNGPLVGHCEDHKFGLP